MQNWSRNHDHAVFMICGICDADGGKECWRRNQEDGDGVEEVTSFEKSGRIGNEACSEKCELKNGKMHRKSQRGRESYARFQDHIRVFIIVKLAKNQTIYM